jgi:RNA polymerase sigma-70 factor (ECF subfamily)
MAEANGLPSLLIRRDGQTVGLVSATVGADGIDGLYWVPAPEKLRAYERSSDRLVRREHGGKRWPGAGPLRRPGQFCLSRSS